MCIWHFFNHETNTPLKNFGPKIPSETNTIQKISKKIRPNTNTRVIFGPKIRSRPIQYKKLPKKIRPNTNTIKKANFWTTWRNFTKKHDILAILEASIPSLGRPHLFLRRPFHPWGVLTHSWGVHSIPGASSPILEASIGKIWRKKISQKSRQNRYDHDILPIQYRRNRYDLDI